MKGKNNPIYAVVKREAWRIMKNPAYRFLLFAGPLIGILLLFFTFREGTVKEIPIAIVDQDQSALSIKLGNAINATAQVDVTCQLFDMFQAEELMLKGEIDAIVLFPDDLEKTVFQGMESSVPVYINGTNVLKAGIIHSSILTTLKTYSSGIQLKKLMLGGKNQEEAMARVMPVQIQKHVLFNPYTNYSYFLNSAMLFVMLYLFVFLSSIYTLGNELKRGTGVELLEASNNSIRLAVAGKMLPYTIIFSGLAMFINYLLYVVEGMPLNGNFWLIVFAQFVTIVTHQLMGVVFVSVTGNLRLALSLGSAYSMMGITFSGLTFPMLAMPLIAKIFGSVFPFTWWEQVFISQSLQGAPIAETLPYICYILIFLLVSLSFLKRYKTLLGDSSYWGKS